MIDDEELKTLLEARARARLILDELRRNQREVEASPPNIAPEKLAEGRTAMEKAIAAAERMLSSLEQALKVAGVQMH